MKVLVLEDDFLEADRICEGINDFFSEGCEIIGPFKEFQGALGFIKTARPDLAIIDIHLGPDYYGGVNFASVLQEVYDIPLIFVSAVSDKKLLFITQQIDFCDFLKKPWQEHSLFKALERAVISDKFKKKSIHRTSILPSSEARFWAKLNKKEYEGILFKDIVAIKSEGHYNKIWVYDKEQPVVIKGNLKTELFDIHFRFFDNFYLLGRSHIINRTHLFKLRGNQIFFKTQFGNPIVISIPRDWKPLIMEWLDIKD